MKCPKNSTLLQVRRDTRSMSRCKNSILNPIAMKIEIRGDQGNPLEKPNYKYKIIVPRIPPTLPCRRTDSAARGRDYLTESRRNEYLLLHSHPPPCHCPAIPAALTSNRLPKSLVQSWKPGANPTRLSPENRNNIFYRVPCLPSCSF